MFLLTAACPDDLDAETVLEAGAAFATLASAQAWACGWADDSAATEEGDRPRDLLWESETGQNRWFCDDRSRSGHLFLIREVALRA